MTDHEETPKLGSRERIGQIAPDATSTENVVARLTEPQKALREAALKHFKSNKLKAYIAKQIEYVNGARQVGEGIRFLFDRDGHAPANMPLEDVIAERKRIENQIAWLEAICAEMQNSLVRILEIEDAALDLLETEGEGA